MAQRNSLVLEKSIGAILRALSSLLVRLRKVFSPNLRQGVPLTSFKKRQVDPCQRERPALDPKLIGDATAACLVGKGEQERLVAFSPLSPHTAGCGRGLEHLLSPERLFG